MAVQIRKLPPDEAARVFPRRGQMDLSAYADALRDLQPGDAAEVDLEGVTPRAMKRRLGQAAKQLGYALKWARQQDDGTLRFRVTELPGSRPRRTRRTRGSED